MSKHTIVLPDPNKFPSKKFGSLWRTYRFSTCLKILSVYEDNVVVKDDYNGELEKAVPNPVHISNQNGKYNSFFLFDNNLFMIIDTDWPLQNHEKWVKYYADNGVKGYFLANPRYCTHFIYDNCEIPVFPLGGKPGPGLELFHLENEDHATSMALDKDISVFFAGNFKSRRARIASAKLIKNNIPNSFMLNTGNNILSSSKYIYLMSRSKLAWCPRSSWSEPDSTCNGPSCKENEAMCLEVMVVKHSIGFMETEERIAGIHFAEVENFDSNLLEVLNYYLEHDDERKEIAHNGRLYFERNCSTTARAFKMFNDCMSAING